MPDYDPPIAELARRAHQDATPAPGLLGAARLELIDALAALFEAQDRGAPAALIAPLLPGATFGGGSRVPGSSLELEPPQGAYAIAWLAGNARVGALLALGDYLARRAVLTGQRPPRVITLLEALLAARALADSIVLPAPFGELPLAAPFATRIALAAVSARWLGSDERGTAAAVSLAFAEGLAPHDGTMARACAAAASTAVRVALLARAGMPPVPAVLSSRPCGLEAALLGGGQVTLLAPAPVSPPPHEELATWHRFTLAVERRFNARQAPKVLAALNATTPIDALPLQSFIAQLVRAG